LCPERRAAQLIFNMNAPTSLAQVVNKADTAASLKTTLSRAISGQNVTLRADVAPTAPGSGTPTGAVTFKDGADTLGTATLNASGQAGFNTSSLAVRDHIITAVYAGDERFNGSTSGVLTQSIKAGADLSVEATASPTSVMAGVKVTYAVTVTNHGTDPAADVKLEDPLPAGLTYLSATTSQGSCAPSQGEVLCLLGGMDAGANAQISIKARPTVAGELTNVFTAMGEMLDPSTANNVAETTINVTPALPGSVIISEFRFRGPGAVLAGAINAAPAPGGGIKRAGVARRPPPRNDIVSAANDEFVEFYNNTDSEIAVGATDGSAGWALVASDGQVRFIIPTGVTIPARGHFLAVNTRGYSLSAYAAGDQVLLPDGVTESGGYTTDIPDGSGVALFRTANPSDFTSDERLDAAGYQGVDQLYREGAGLPPGGAETTVNLEYSYFRDMRTPGGLPKDTSDNLADFLCADTSGAMLGAGQLLGAPGPENLSSPINRNASVSASLLDTNSGAQNAPNRVRDLQQDPGHNSTFGTLSIRRTITNTTGGQITRLRFRVMDVTTFPPPLGRADLRVLTSTDVVVTLSGTAQCAPDTPPCQVKAYGTTLEQPAAQPSGGGWNSSLAAGMVTLAAPLADGDKISVQFLLGVQRTGAFRFYVSVEALP
jgi:uncharacterized repeat protein (TIGR01451 family)